MQWFRFHAASVHKHKVQALSGDLFKFWVNLLCVACEADKPGGALPPASDIAWTLRMDEAQVSRMLAALTLAGLLEMHDETYAPHEWDTYQYKTSTDRTRKWREKNVTSDASVPENTIGIDFGAGKEPIVTVLHDGKKPTPMHFGDVPIIVSETMPTNVIAIVPGDGREPIVQRFGDVPGDVTETHQNRTETKTEQRQTQSAPPPSVARDFDAFMRAYPASRRGFVNAAKQAWLDTHARGELPELMTALRALTAHKESSEWQREGGRFIPNMAKYIDARMWEAPPINAPPPPKRVPNQTELNAPARGKLVI